MEDNRNHNNKNNYDDLFLRNLLVGLSYYINDKIKIVYTSKEQGEYEHTIPFYFKSGADTQFLIDAFYDDIPDNRVHTNTDVVPRCVIDFESWSTNDENFTNPTVWYNVPHIEDDELKMYNKQIKWIPINVSGTFNFTVNTLYEQWAIWQEFISKQYTYSYFTFEHKYITVQSYIEYNFDNNNEIQFDSDFSHKDRIVSPYPFTIKTHIPVLDTKSKYSNMNEFWNNIENNIYTRKNEKK